MHKVYDSFIGAERYFIEPQDKYIQGGKLSKITFTESYVEYKFENITKLYMRGDSRLIAPDTLRVSIEHYEEDYPSRVKGNSWRVDYKERKIWYCGLWTYIDSLDEGLRKLIYEQKVERVYSILDSEVLLYKQDIGIYSNPSYVVECPCGDKVLYFFEKKAPLLVI